jgi:cell division GTPase FtsZ
MLGVDIIIGIGGLGSRLGEKIAEMYNIKYLSIDESLIPNLLSPSINELRNAIHEYKSVILKDIQGSVLIIGDLTEKASIAYIPLLSAFIKQDEKEVCSLITMPYKIEMNRLYEAKQALEHIHKNSDYNIIIDKDALLQINPDLTVKEANFIIDNAIIGVSTILFSQSLESKDNLLSISNNKDVRNAISEALRMLYIHSIPDKAEDVLIHISYKGVKISEAARISEYVNDIFSSARICVSMNENENGLLLMTSTHAKFDEYDPLLKIEHNMDPDLDNIMRINLPLKQMELI